MKNRIPLFLVLILATIALVAGAADVTSYNKNNVSMTTFTSNIPTLTGLNADFASQQVLNVTKAASQTATIPAGTDKMFVFTSQNLNWGSTDVSGSTVADATKPYLAANTSTLFVGSEAELAKVSFIAASDTATVTVRFQ